MITKCSSIDQAGWFHMRQQLWPHSTRSEHLEEMRACLAAPEKFAQFVACDTEMEPVGFAEVAIRTDYVNGTASSPVAFLEGIFVQPCSRRSGFGSSLVEAVREWARERGCSELASDAAIDNPASHAMHLALGFEETERVVYFRRRI